MERNRKEWGLARFQSTPSVGRATCGEDSALAVVKGISIHALRGEGDAIDLPNVTQVKHFNPRPPWGGRRVDNKINNTVVEFQSTPSVGRATTYSGLILTSKYQISIHALRGEGDINRITTIRLINKFQSTPSVGRATRNPSPIKRTPNISIHALRGEGDLRGCALQSTAKISIHALRGEGDA